MAEHINLVYLHQPLIFFYNVGDVVWPDIAWRAISDGLVDSHRHVAVVSSFRNSDMAVIAQHHPPFFLIQNSGRFQRLEKRLYSGDWDESTALFDAMRSSMPRVNVTKTENHISDMIRSVPNVFVHMSSCVNAADLGVCIDVLNALDDLAFVILLSGGGQEWGLTGPLGRNMRNILTVPGLQPSKVHMHKSRWHLIRRVKPS